MKDRRDKCEPLMMESYVNDYLTMVKRVRWNGQLGLLCGGNGTTFKDLRMWQSR